MKTEGYIAYTPGNMIVWGAGVNREWALAEAVSYSELGSVLLQVHRLFEELGKTSVSDELINLVGPGGSAIFEIVPATVKMQLELDLAGGEDVEWTLKNGIAMTPEEAEGLS